MTPHHFSSLARRSSEPPISWLMRLKLERPELISLAAGFTDNATLPVREVRELCRAVLRDRTTLQYGSTAGLPALRRELVRGTDASPEEVVVTNGSQQLLYLLTEVLCDPGDVVLVEDPTYFVYLGILESMGVRAFGFDTLAQLKAKFDYLKARRLLPRLKMLYLVTYFRNPTGFTWSLAMKREALALVKHYEKAAGHPIYIVEDAAYRDLRFEGEDVPSFLELDRRRVAYTNTLTKPFATGLKIGYGILPGPLRQAVLRSKGNQDFGSANFLQAILARALAQGMYQRHLPVIAGGYRRKRDVMVAALGNHFSYEVPTGGLYVWVGLPGGTATGVKSRLFRDALAAGLLYVPGEMCYAADPTRPTPRNFIRLSFGAPPAAQIRRGVHLLRTVAGL